MQYPASGADAHGALLRHPLAARPAALVGLRADQTGAPEPPLLLAPGRDPHLPGAEEPGRAGPREGDHVVERPAVPHRLRHHRQGPPGAAVVARRTVRTAATGVG